MNITILDYRKNHNNCIYFSMKKGEIDQIIGHNLRRLRLSFKMTQEALAESLEIESCGLISDWERGIKGIGKDVLERLCNIFKVRPYEFYIEDDTPLPSSELEQKILFALVFFGRKSGGILSHFFSSLGIMALLERAIYLFKF